MAISQQMSPGPSIQLLDDDGSRQLEYERDHATINGAVAMIDGSRCTKCVFAGATAISGWLLCESRPCFHHGCCVVAVVVLCFFFDRRSSAGEKGDRLKLNLNLR